MRYRNLFEVKVNGTALILRVDLMIGYRKKIMPHFPFLLPENKKIVK